MSRQRRPSAADTPRVIHALPVVVDSTTVAAVGPDRTFAYSDANWREIKLSLTRVNVDADAVMVGDRWWAQYDPVTAFTAAPQRSLREQLEALASDYRALSCWRKERRSLTPKQEAAEIQKVLNALERARFTLNSSRVGIITRESGAVHEAMSAFTAKLKRWRDGLKAMDSRSNINARKVHIEFWGELAVLWKAITAGQAPRGPSHFLYVCSAPAFPETTQGRIRTFLDQLQ
jgi:hypothetical protein